MDYSENEVLEFIEENDVKFIRLAFCDIFGTQRNISIMPNELKKALKEGVCFNASSVKGFMNAEDSDLYLHPDVKTLSILPWRPQHGRVLRFFCDIKYPDGRHFEGDGRHIIKKVIKKGKDMGYSFKVGSECEFYLFQQDENGNPTNIPQDYAGYCDIAPIDKGENIRREICLILDEMGIELENSHHEQGPGQNEISFYYVGPLSAADNIINFKSVVKTSASTSGLFASFMPKPFINENGSGLYFNFIICDNKINLFEEPKMVDKEIVHKFIAGIMNRIKEITLFLNPITNSYSRFGSYNAPKYITWSHKNLSQLIKLTIRNDEYKNIKLRSPDPSCNPYLALALLIGAGLEGIEKNLSLCEPCNTNLSKSHIGELKDIETLPKNMYESINLSKNNEFIKSILPEKTITNYIDSKEQEWRKYDARTDKEKVERELYFSNI